MLMQEPHILQICLCDKEGTLTPSFNISAYRASEPPPAHQAEGEHHRIGQVEGRHASL
jgi:hypothetical protein